MAAAERSRWWFAVASFAYFATAGAAWPDGPLSTSGRWITDAADRKVNYAGANWPASLDTMVPEGLQYQSVEGIVAKIKSLGMNVIRLTYATELIDQYYSNGEQDIPIQQAFTDALGQEAGMDVYARVVANNPSFNGNTTRLAVFDAVADECANQQIYVHLDNHISKAGWCCTPFDGNAWWGDTYFNTSNWLRGLSFMADHGKSWPNLMSMSLRNELRPPLSDLQLASSSYNWEDWYARVRQGADAINSANADVLIFLSGLDSDADLSVVVQGTALTPGTQTFSRGDFAGYDDKLVLELHSYANILGASPTNCSQTEYDLDQAGFDTLDNATNTFPLVVTEFGFEQDNNLTQQPYADCLLSYFPQQKAGWMIWELGGSYYVRQGTQDYDESWGLLTHDWSDWRAPNFVSDSLRPAVNATLSGDGSTVASPASSNTPGGSPSTGSSDQGSSASTFSLREAPSQNQTARLLLLAVFLSLLHYFG